MESNKAERFGVSMPGSLLEAIDAHVTETNEDRSAYLRRLAQADLASAGKLPGTPAHDIRAEALSAAEIAGADVVLAALRAVKSKGYAPAEAAVAVVAVAQKEAA